jgi:hypothetical protein
MEEDYYLFIHLLGRGGELAGNEDSYHGWGSYPTSLWQIGETIADSYRLSIKESARAPTLIRVDVGLYDPSTEQGLAVFDQAGHAVGTSVVAGQARMVPQGRQEPAIDQRLDLNLANMVALVGYRVDRAELGPGEDIRLTLYWRGDGEMSTDYTVFTHLVDKEGAIWSQSDSQPLGGDYPTSSWDSGEIIEDEYILTIPETAPTGVYRLEVGMYELETRQRLPVLNDDGEVEDDRILLPSTVTVKRDE